MDQQVFGDIVMLIINFKIIQALWIPGQIYPQGIFPTYIIDFTNGFSGNMDQLQSLRLIQIVKFDDSGSRIRLYYYFR